MKRMKRLLTTLLAVLFMLCMSVSLVGCKRKDLYQLCENEYFIYSIHNETNKINICGFTDKAREEKYLIIPKTIDGNLVCSIGYRGFPIPKILEKYGNEATLTFRSDTLKKIYIVSDIEIVSQSMKSDIDIIGVDSIFYISNSSTVIPTNYYRTNAIATTKSTSANVSYDYNYENSPNDGYYWIDNYSYGERIEYIPEQPIRDGYAFGGWYKESECINARNFETDTLPQAQYDEQEREIYQETKLYAKWIKE